MGFFHEVWMHSNDQELALSVTERDRKQYVQVMMDMANHLYQVEPDQVIPFTTRPLIHDLYENMIIHLGHRDIRVIKTPVVYLLKPSLIQSNCVYVSWFLDARGISWKYLLYLESIGDLIDHANHYLD